MYGIGHGIDVHFDNNKSNPDIVLIQGEVPIQYFTNDILIEILSEQSIEMLTEKAANMIKVYPGANDIVTIESIKSGFQWLYGTVENETLPVSTELFRSSFNNAIHVVYSRQNSYETINQFLYECYNEYMKDINGFLLFFDALASHDSGICNKNKNNYAEIFLTNCRPFFEEYKKKCSKRQKGERFEIWAFNISSFMDLLVYIYSRLSHEHRNVKICSNCGRYFIPLKRSDEKYCSYYSPQNPDKTCKEIGANRKRLATIQEDSDLHAHHNNMGRLYNAIRRAKQSGDQQEIIDYFWSKLNEEKYKLPKG